MRLIVIALSMALLLGCSYQPFQSDALLDKIEGAMKQALRIAATQENLKPDADFGALANLLRCYVVGRWEQYARSGFSREPLTQWPQQWPMLYFACLSQSGAPGA